MVGIHIPNMTGDIDVRLLSNLTFGKQREVKKHELRLKVRSIPITVPDAVADLSMAICKSVYRMILSGIDKQVVMKSETVQDRKNVISHIQTVCALGPVFLILIISSILSNTV